MRVLVACEFSGEVRRAFEARGHEAWSVDFLPAEDGANDHYRSGLGAHWEGDVVDFLGETGPDNWDLMIAHPHCTYLCNSGVRWLHTEDGRMSHMEEAARFFRWLLDYPIPRVCVENPVMHKYAIEIVGRRQDQIIQPWQFGHGQTKATGLWLKNLPKLVPTNIVDGREPKVHWASPGKDRWKDRSRTYPGIARAMAEQWGKLLNDGTQLDLFPREQAGRSLLADRGGPAKAGNASAAGT
jgi:hypothetical protein